MSQETPAILPAGDTVRYSVTLPIYEGPLDLLLHLIEREELDITVISLVQITDQYLAYIESLREVNADQIADFLVIAARLLLIKSQALLPRPPAFPGEEEEDPGEQLARQLREYKRFKQVAEGLSAREAEHLHCFVRMAPPPKITTKSGLEEVSLDMLLAAARRALQVVPPAPPVGQVVRPFTITIAQRQQTILDWTLAGRTFTFRSLLEDARSRDEIVVTLLAILELWKRQRILVSQDALFGEIHIAAAPETAAKPDAGAPAFWEEGVEDESPEEVNGAEDSAQSSVS